MLHRSYYTLTVHRNVLTFILSTTMIKRKKQESHCNLKIHHLDFTKRNHWQGGSINSPTRHTIHNYLLYLSENHMSWGTFHPKNTDLPRYGVAGCQRPNIVDLRPSNEHHLRTTQHLKDQTPHIWEKNKSHKKINHMKNKSHKKLNHTNHVNKVSHH